MSDAPADAAQQSQAGPGGVLVTWRESPRSVKAVLLAIFVSRLGGFLQVFLVLYLAHLGFREVQAGLALGAYGAGSVLGVLLGGAVSDRLGSRWTIAAGMLAASVLLVSIVYVRPYPLLLAVVTSVGAVSQIYRPASASLLAKLTPQSRQVMVFAMSRLALNLGTTAAPLLGAALIPVSYRLLFWGEAVAALSCVAVMLLLVPARLEAVGQPTDDQPRIMLDPGPDGAELLDLRVADRPERRQRGGYLAIAADRRYLLYLLAIAVNSAVYIQYVAALPLAMREAGFRPFWYSVMVALNGLVVICFELPVTTVVSRWPARRVIGVGFPLLGAGLAAYSLPGGLAVFVTGTLLWSLAEIIEGPTMFAYPAQAGPQRLQGRYIGAGQGMFGLGAAIGPVAGVALWSAIGGRFWIVCGLVSVLALVPGWRGIRPERARVSTAANAL